jgi:hypothetical protein
VFIKQLRYITIDDEEEDKQQKTVVNKKPELPVTFEIPKFEKPRQVACELY